MDEAALPDGSLPFSLSNEASNSTLAERSAVAGQQVDPVAATAASDPAMLSIIERSIYRGPNIHSKRPMVRIRVDLGPLEQRPTDTLPGFSQELLALLPGLHRHHCSTGHAGGFVERLGLGTWLGHVAEHVAIELQSMAGSEVTRGKTRSVKRQPGRYDILYEYRDERAALLAGLHALRLVTRLLPDGLAALSNQRALPPSALPETASVSEIVAEIREAAARSAFGPSTQSIVDAARCRGIPVIRLDDRSLLQLGYGSRQRRVRASITGLTPHIAVELAGDKQATRQLLRDAALPAPAGIVVRSIDEAFAASTRLIAPWVIKPLSANHGRGVSLGLRSREDVVAAFEKARAHAPRVIIEEQIAGDDHRLLVVAGKLVAAARRLPAAVTGDGVNTIESLVEIENGDTRRGAGHENVLTRLKLDAETDRVLANQGLTRSYVPALGMIVRIRDTANLSTGGTAEDCTDTIHPDNVFIAEQAAAIIGLDVAGIDFLSPDITRPVSETGGGIVEINAAPGLRMHLAPSHGKSRDVAGPIVDHLVPRPRASRIPIVAITGTNGKSTTARMVARIIRESGKRVGLTTTSGVYIDDRLVKVSDASGPKSARMVLTNPTVDAAVLETARGGILREGLGFDRCDVGCVLNVTEDHLGIKGIDSVEDLANVKSVVVEAVGRRGCSVLNADDPLTRKMVRHAGGKLVWFAMSGTSDLIREHCEAGGSAVVRDVGHGRDGIVLCRGARREHVIYADEIPATQGGAAQFNTENALAATAMAAMLGIDLTTIRAALAGFGSSFDESPGRLNIVDIHGITVIVDYAHNPAAVSALATFLETLRRPGRRFIGVFSVPGDRRNEDLVGMGTLAASIFDELVCRETPDGRGRPRGEINALMSRGAIAGGLSSKHVHRVVEEEKATLFSLGLAKQGDVVVLSPSQVDVVWKLVNAFRPAWASSTGSVLHDG